MQLCLLARMVHPLLVVHLLCASVLGGAADVSSHKSRGFLQEDQQQPVVYKKLPGIPSKYQAAFDLSASDSSAQFGYTEATTAQMHAHAAEGMEAAAAAQLVAESQGLSLNSASLAAMTSAQRATEYRKGAQAAARRSYGLVAEMPALAAQFVDKAVNDAVDEAVEKMNVEATLVVEEQARIEKALAKKATKEAQLAAMPFQQAKLRAGQTMVDYIAQGRDLAQAVTELKNKAPVLQKFAQGLQDRGDVVHAQQYQIMAKDMLDKANQLASQAVGFDKTANKINGGLGMYDLAAGAASSYAAYTNNPGAGLAGGLPPLPMPLKLVDLSSGGPGPAPAPAAAS